MDSFVIGIDDAARLVTAIGSVAIALAIFRFVRGRPDLSMRARRLAAVFAVLVLFIGALSFLANLDGTGYVPSMQSAVRVAVAAFTVVGAV
jgi:4-amino-4-deoxy-L-arabinose transferase-like glycosyltransferase